jgi:hypothetical protein
MIGSNASCLERRTNESVGWKKKRIDDEMKVGWKIGE